MKIEKSIFAGMCISIGCIAYIKIGGTVGALLFSLGLLTVLVNGYDLFTGKTCKKEWLKKPTKLFFCLLFNFLGCWVVYFTCGNLEDVKEQAAVIVDGKLGRSDIAILSAAVLCGMLIAIAVKSNSKIDAILAVMIFVLAGAEHVVADGFYLLAGNAPVKSAIWFLCKVGFGNLIGGMLFCDLTEGKGDEK